MQRRFGLDCIGYLHDVTSMAASDIEAATPDDPSQISERQRRALKQEIERKQRELQALSSSLKRLEQT